MRFYIYVARTFCRTFVLSALLGTCAGQVQEGSVDLNSLLLRTNAQVTGFLDQFSDVKCTEQVEQTKLANDGKVELKEDSTYDYLVILTSSGGELSLDESRLPVHEARKSKKNLPLLISNGFATLFLVFHPYYSNSFEFGLAGEEEVDGQKLVRVKFRHVPGTRAPAALALRGRDYPLELSGVAWINPHTGVIVKIEAGIEDSLEDVGLKSLHSEVDFSPAPFHDMREPYWFPTIATVEVETPRQHWRNTHRFTEYKRFSVSTEEQVAGK